MGRPGISYKTGEQIAQMRRAGAVVAEVLSVCSKACVPGITTGELDELAHATFTARKAEGLFYGYPTYEPGRGYPRHTCISVNEEIVHGIPGDRIVRDGDIVSIDCGVRLGEWCADAARTIMVGEVDEKSRRLVETTRACLQLAIDRIRPGVWWSAISGEMERLARRAGFGIVREYVGHGLGRTMHEEPRVVNYGIRKRGPEDFKLEVGLVIAIEPMLVIGSGETIVLDDGWTVISADRGRAAHEEHTVAIGEAGAEILTG